MADLPVSRAPLAMSRFRKDAVLPTVDPPTTGVADEAITSAPHQKGVLFTLQRRGRHAMDLDFGPEYDRFRREVAGFLAQEWPGRAERSPEEVRAFRRLATERGYLYRTVPRRYGGSEQEPDGLKAEVIREEFSKARAPHQVDGIGVEMVVPTLLERGEEWQCEKFIESTLLGETIWCQGYSEPGAGSDLASLQSTAVLQDGEWVINGQKVWTTNGHNATYMFALVRTEPDAPTKWAGLSYLLLAMDQPGVDVRPLRQVDGGAEFNEVFLTDARTPEDWIVGKRGEGWSISSSTLKHERAMVGSVKRSESLYRSLVKLAKRTTIDGKPAIEQAWVQDRLVVLQGYLESQRFSGYLQLSRSLVGEPAGRLSLKNKVLNTDFGQQVSALALDLLGPTAQLAPRPRDTGDDVGDERWMAQFFGSLGLAIAGGTANIQRNIIAERGLGLPRDATAGAKA
jgi:alkylation response protein AidB-like acyl-CoA dehydrogenase